MSETALEGSSGVDLDANEQLLEPQEGEILEGVAAEEIDDTQPQGADSEEVFCKICRLGSEEGNPLYHPCKCSVCRLIFSISSLLLRWRLCCVLCSLYNV